MNASRRGGFTLVELLVVIAIIAILASFVAVALPRVLENAKIRRMENALTNIRTSLVQYYTDHNTYPPRYGYRTRASTDLNANPGNQPAYFNLKPYLHYIQQYNNTSIYDEFSQGFSTELGGSPTLRLLEWSPDVEGDLATGLAIFPDVLYDGSNEGATGRMSAAYGDMLDKDQRPFIYIPVNTRQFKKFRQYWLQRGAATGNFYATDYDPTDPALRGATSFPPPSYDAYVLIGVGPGASTFGLIDDFPGNIPADQAVNLYHVAGMRAYYLATRDLNQNGELDFHFRARTSQSEGDALYDVTVGGNTVDPTPTPAIYTGALGQEPLGPNAELFPNSLPTSTAPSGYGP